MNAKDISFPQLPSYEAAWHALRFEPMRGTGESFTCAILIKDAQGAEVKQVIRDDILKALFGQYADHVQTLIDTAIASLATFAQERDPTEWTPPITGFFISDARSGRSLTEREGVLRQAVKLSAAFAQLDFGNQEDNERPALEAARTFISKVRQQVSSSRSDLDMFFQKSVNIVPNGSPVQFGFLMPRRAAHFEVLRPSTLSTSIRFARGKLYELRKARTLVPLERAALIVGVPYADDLSYSDKQHAAIRRELGELRQEAMEDETDILPAENTERAAFHIVDIAT